MSYTDTFGGSTVQPADVSYRAVALTASVVLVWPPYSQTSTDVLARIMDVTPSGAGLSITLPPANQVSAGQDALFRNLGASTFTVLDNAGGAVATIPAGEVRYIYLRNNSSAAGLWASITFGVGVGSLDAAGIAGAGLAAAGALLQLSLTASTVNSSFTVGTADRAREFVWTGGSGTITLPTASVAASGFLFLLRNQGTGVLTLAAAGGEFVDGAATISLQPQESAIVTTTGLANWYTIGRGRNQQFNFTLLVKNITGGTVVLTNTEAANIVQRYTGTLTSNAEVTLPGVVQVYYVSNQTSGAFTVTFRTAGVGTTVSVPSGQNAVLFCDGVNVINNSTTVSGLTSVLLSAGSATAPSLAYNGDTSTGIYQPASGSVSIAGTGTEVARFTGGASRVNRLTFTNALTGNAPTVGAEGTDTNINLSLTPKGTGGVLVPQGAVATPGLAFTGRTNSGLWSPDATSLAVSVGGSERARFGTTATHTLLLSTAAAGFATLTLGDNAAGGVAISFDSGNTRDTSALWFRSNQREYSVLGGTTAGPGIKARWDSATTNRYLTFGRYDAAGTWTEAVRVQEDNVSMGTTLIGNAKLTLGGAVNLLRAINDNGVIEGYNSANSVRTGYLQFVTGASVLLAAEGSGVGVRLYANGQEGLYVHPTRTNTILGSTTDSVYTAAGRRVLEITGAGEQLFSMAATPGSATNSFYLHNTGATGLNMLHSSGPISLYPAGTLRLGLTTDGRVYGTALHNNAGSVAGTSNQYIASGTYTPTGAAQTNSSSVTPNKAQWARVGNVVSVSGSVTWVSTSPGFSTVTLSLPISSNLTALSDLAGGAGGVQSTAAIAGYVFGDTTGDTAVVAAQANTNGASLTVYYSFIYEIK